MFGRRKFCSVVPAPSAPAPCSPRAVATTTSRHPPQAATDEPAATDAPAGDDARRRRRHRHVRLELLRRGAQGGAWPRRSPRPASTTEINTVDHNTYQENFNTYIQQPDDVMPWFAGYRMRAFAGKGVVGDISDVWAAASTPS